MSRTKKRSILYGTLLATVLGGLAFHRWVFAPPDAIPQEKSIPPWVIPEGCDAVWTVGPFVFARKGDTVLIPSYGYVPHQWHEVEFHDRMQPFYGKAKAQLRGAQYEIAYRSSRVGEDTLCPCPLVVIEWVLNDHVAAQEQWATSELPKAVGAVGEKKRGQLLVEARSVKKEQEP